MAAVLVGALLMIAAAPASGQLPGALAPVTDAVPDVPAVPTLPDPPVEVPDVPTVSLPDVPVKTPGPVATPAPVATPVRAGTPAAAQPAAKPSAPVASGSAGGQTVAPARGSSSAPAATRSGRRRAQATPRQRPRATATPRAATPRPAAATPVARDEHRAASAAPRAPEHTEAQGGVARIAGSVEDLVAALPAAVLWALLGIAALALGLAGNAYWQSRQRAALEAQRAALLEDVGLLSSALLPPVPGGFEGLTVSAAYRPADGPAAGGDFYDVFSLGPRRIGVLLGDVSGHGRDSVTQAALARYTLRTLLAAGHPPGEALAEADRLLARDLAPHFVTVIAAVYDEASAQLTYAKAGHAPPIVLGTAHDADAEQSACPIGLGLGQVWPEFHLQLGEAVSVCLYTDGLEDARLDGTRLGRDQVLRLLAAQDLPDAAQLIRDVGGYADHLSDDLAAVVLRGH